MVHAKTIKKITVILALLLPFVIIGEIKAQAPETSWKEPTLIFQGTGTIYFPTVIADKYGLVHVFWIYIPPVETTEARYGQIYYTRWDGNIWSKPVDIIVADSFRSFSVTIDLNNQIDLIWVTGTGELYFSHSSIEDAEKPRSWSTPVVLINSGQGPGILADSDGQLFIVFPDQFGGVSYLHSMDGGTSWSAQKTIATSSTIASAASTTFLAISDSGIIHVVWTEFHLPDGWPPIGVFYSKSADNGDTWTPAMKIDGEGYDQINIITGKDGIVHLAWNGMVGVYGRYHCWSRNDGESWSGIETVIDWGATSGPPGLVLDSLGALHFLTTDGEAAWYSNWDNQLWSTPLQLPRGEIKSSYWIEESNLSINRGNQLHAVYWSDRQKLWYTTTQIASPAETAVPMIETESVEPTRTSISEVILTTPSPISSPTTYIPISKISNDISGPGMIFLVSLAPVIILIGGIIVIRSNINRKRH